MLSITAGISLFGTMLLVSNGRTTTAQLAIQALTCVVICGCTLFMWGLYFKRHIDVKRDEVLSNREQKLADDTDVE